MSAVKFPSVFCCLWGIFGLVLHLYCCRSLFLLFYVTYALVTYWTNQTNSGQSRTVRCLLAFLLLLTIPLISLSLQAKWGCQEGEYDLFWNQWALLTTSFPGPLFFQCTEVRERWERDTLGTMLCSLCGEDLCFVQWNRQGLKELSAIEHPD